MSWKYLLPALLAVALAGCGRSGPHDLIVTGAKPDRLFVIDAGKRAVLAQFHIPDANQSVGVIVPSPDGRVAYVLVNRMESISGIDLTTGKQVFRADLSSPGERVKCMFAFDVTPDGRELIVYELPVKLEQDEYQVEEPRFAVFATSAGVAAKPVRSFPAPRRVHMVLAKKDGKSFYSVGFELDEIDVRTGRVIAQRGIRSWNRPDHFNPDLLAIWPVSEPTGVFVSPVYSTRGSGEAAAGGIPTTSLMSLNLTTGELKYQDFEKTAALIFSSVLSPARPEAFGVYAQLTKIDTQHGTLANRVNLDHTFYSVNIATDGSEVYLGGA
ncbi:MAG TPA: quinohemoprotein amine dehydrogenase subunit beta, partial [Steroidobacteraceae bacterium]|nr:quinohemoprotein amine dehydrogenase subunit beta [Steroidobacteraceae bacterium]